MPEFLPLIFFEIFSIIVYKTKRIYTEKEVNELMKNYQYKKYRI